MKLNPVFEAYKDLPALVQDSTLMPAWSPDGRTLGFATGSVEQRQAWRIDLASGEKTPLFDVARLREAVRAATGTTPAGQGAPFAHFGFAGPNSIAFAVGADQLVVDLDDYSVIKAPTPSAIDTYLGLTEAARRTPRPFKRSAPLIDPMDAFEVPSPDGHWLLSIQEHNVALRSTCDGRTVRLTSDGTAEVEWNFDWLNPMLAILGMAVPVTNWSPNGEKVAVYKVDHRGVARMPQPHFLKRIEDSVHRAGARAGGALETCRLYVLDVAGGAPIEIQLGDTRDTYPVHAGWLPDASGLLVFRMSRDCRKVDVLLADAFTGAVRPVFSEQGETFIRIHHDVYYGRKLGLELTPDGRHVLWLSERDGYQHIYKYDLNGRLAGQLTSGPWPVESVVRVTGGYVYFNARIDTARPYDTHFCRVPLEGGAVEQLTDAPGRHSVMLSPASDVFIDNWSTPDKPPVMALRSVDGRCLNGEIARADISKMQQVGYTPAEQFVVQAADGVTDLWGVMYKPHDFDPGKTYPVVEYIYGGPQIAVTDHGFAAGTSMASEAVRLAQLGCVCVMLDARGTPGRSKAFHDVVYRNWAGALVADHAAAIRQLVARFPYLDGSRVGVTGHSWGGYSSSRLLLDAPDVYKCAVSSAPGYDPFASVLYECYLGLPQSNRAAYDAADVVRLGPKLQGALMIVCGTSDHFCWPDAMKLSESLIRAGKDHEFVPMPEQGHGYAGPSNDYMQRKRAEFFDRHLGGEV